MFHLWLTVRSRSSAEPTVHKPRTVGTRSCPQLRDDPWIQSDGQVGATRDGGGTNRAIPKEMTETTLGLYLKVLNLIYVTLNEKNPDNKTNVSALLRGKKSTFTVKGAVIKHDTLARRLFFSFLFPKSSQRKAKPACQTQ